MLSAEVQRKDRGEGEVMFARSKTSGQGHGLTRRIVAFLGSLLTLALVLSTLGFIHPSQVQAAPVNNKEPYTIGLEYNYDSQDQSTCYVYDSNNGFCSKRDDNWAINRNPDIARLLVNTEDYPTTNGPLTVVLRVPRRDVVEITSQGSIGGKAAGSADPTVAHGFETIDGGWLYDADHFLGEVRCNPHLGVSCTYPACFAERCP